MPSLYNRLTLKKKKDILVLANFVNVYCRGNHKETAKQTLHVADENLKVRLCDLNLCPDCSRLLEHGIAKLSLCPYYPKPS